MATDPTNIKEINAAKAAAAEAARSAAAAKTVASADVLAGMRALINTVQATTKNLQNPVLAGSGNVVDTGLKAISDTGLATAKKSASAYYSAQETADRLAAAIPAPTYGTSNDNADAFALLKDIFTTWGLESLIPDIEGYMKQNIGPNEATYLLKQTTAYKTRFAGNETRRKAGLNVLSEAEYLSMEDKYSQLLKQYGQQNLATKSEFADLIGGDVSAVELNSRLNMAVTRVQQADPNILKALKDYYPGVTDSDLVGYFLAPDKKLPELEQKVTTGEIAAAALQAGVAAPSLATAQELAGLGVDQAAARAGYQNVAQVLPGAQKLSDIYKEAGVGYTQATAESEFFKGTASAQRKRKQLAELEQAAFGGQSGVGTSGIGSLGKSATGLF